MREREGRTHFVFRDLSATFQKLSNHCCQMSERALLCSKVLCLRPLVLQVRVVLRCKWLWSVGGMVLTGETEVLGGKHYIAWVVGECMGMEHWWNGTDRGKLKYWERNII